MVKTYSLKNLSIYVPKLNVPLTYTYTILILINKSSKIII